MSYTVFARKYRPQSFQDLVGQEHVAQTLGNAIHSGRIAHAFLFTGVRGVGKTSTARLLAKALNCERGPTDAPCNRCDACVEITAGTDLDVLEMDGASNNSVDDVRRLQESLPFRPARDRHKVVIVDEVHMLSTGAFNALLKTLEEPPSHVKFIFATTEAHKLPVTIRSRCQRYDFRLIPERLIAERIGAILSNEGIEADEAAVAIVTREAAGSMRDALTLLDQLASSGDAVLRGAEVARILGIAERTLVESATEALLEGDGAAALRAVSAIAEAGVDLAHFTRQLVEALRDLVVLRITGDESHLLETEPEAKARARALSEKVELLELERAFSALSRLVDEVGRSSIPNMVLEMGLVRIATRPPLLPVAELLGRLEALERRVTGRGHQGGGSGAGGSRRPTRQSFVSGDGRGTATRSAGSDPRPIRSSSPPDPSPVRPPKSTETRLPERPVEPAVEPAVASEPANETPGVAQEWLQIVTHLKEAKPALAAIVEHGAVVELSKERVSIAFPEGSFFGQQAKSAESMHSMEDAAGRVLGGSPMIEIVFDTQAHKARTSLAELEAVRVAESKEKARREALQHPRVLDALQVFPGASAEVHFEEPKTT